jgi:hypothetical protein
VKEELQTETLTTSGKGRGNDLSLLHRVPNSGKVLGKRQCGVKGGVKGKRNLRDEKIIDLTDDCTLWDQVEDGIKLSYEGGDSCFNAIKNIVSLGTKKSESIIEKLCLLFHQFVESYYDNVDKSKGKKWFLNKNFLDNETRKITLILVFERLKDKEEAYNNFLKAYQENPKGGLSRVKLCSHAWKYSAQEAQKILDVCKLKVSRAHPRRKLIEYCRDAAEQLFAERSKVRSMETSDKSKLISAFRIMKSLGLLKIDIEDYRENGFPRGTSLQTIFVSDFFERCNNIIFAEDEK